jgi:hypothetical protein
MFFVHCLCIGSGIPPYIWMLSAHLEYPSNQKVLMFERLESGNILGMCSPWFPCSCHLMPCWWRRAWVLGQLQSTAALEKKYSVVEGRLHGVSK